MHDDPYSFQTRIVLRQVDPCRSERETHNRLVAEEVATIIADFDEREGNNPLHRDIIVQTKGEGGLQRIPYHHSSYIPLRYPLLFPHGGPNWQSRVTRFSNTVLPDDHLLAVRNRNRERMSMTPIIYKFCKESLQQSLITMKTKELSIMPLREDVVIPSGLQCKPSTEKRLW